MLAVSCKTVFSFGFIGAITLIIEKSGSTSSFPFVGVEVPFFTGYALKGRAMPFEIESLIQSIETHLTWFEFLAALYLSDVVLLLATKIH